MPREDSEEAVRDPEKWAIGEIEKRMGEESKAVQRVGKNPLGDYFQRKVQRDAEAGMDLRRSRELRDSEPSMRGHRHRKRR